MNLHPTKLVLGLLAVPIMAGSAWLSAAVAKYGVHLDPAGVDALATAGAAGALGVVAKLIHDVKPRDRRAPAPAELPPTHMLAGAERTPAPAPAPSSGASAVGLAWPPR